MKFKVGDEVIGNKFATRYTITRKGWKGVVVDVYNKDRIEVRELGDPRSTSYTVDARAFDLIKPKLEREAVEL